MSLKNKKIKADRISDNRPEPEEFSKRTGYRTPKFKTKNKTKDKTMLSFIQKLASTGVGRAVTGLLGGVLGLGGSVGAGLDIEFALIVACAAIVACFLGVDKAVKFFTAINDARNKEKKKG